MSLDAALTKAVEEFPLFKGRKEKERFLVALGLLTSRTVTLAKAAEVAGLSRIEFSSVLKALGVEFSYLDEEEAKLEAEAAKSLAKRN